MGRCLGAAGTNKAARALNFTTTSSPAFLGPLRPLRMPNRVPWDASPWSKVRMPHQRPSTSSTPFSAATT